MEEAGLRYDEITELTWDEDDPDGNVAHIQAHGVQPWEVRQALMRATVFITVGTEGDNPVYMAVGPTANNRRPRLLEVWGIHYQGPPHAGSWRTITAMDARRKARQLYETEQEGL